MIAIRNESLATLQNAELQAGDGIATDRYNRLLTVTTPGSSPIPAAVVPYTGQVVIAITGTRVRLSVASKPLVNGVIVNAKASNNAAGGTIGDVTVTNTVDGTGNGAIIAPGASTSFAVADINALYVNGTAGDIFSYNGS